MTPTLTLKFAAPYQGSAGYSAVTRRWTLLTGDASNSETSGLVDFLNEVPGPGSHIPCLKHYRRALGGYGLGELTQTAVEQMTSDI